MLNSQLDILKKTLPCTVLLLLCLSATGASVADVSVEEEDTDSQAAIKCDACILMATKFSEGFHTAESRIRSVRLSEQQLTEAAEGICDDKWLGYGAVEESGAERLAGPGTGRELSTPTEGENIWSHRLQDLCDELLAEVSSERALYESWSSANDALEQLLCKGEGTFGACRTKSWGPWPGDDDDYDEYDEGDFEYVHDEF